MMINNLILAIVQNSDSITKTNNLFILIVIAIIFILILGTIFGNRK